MQYFRDAREVQVMRGEMGKLRVKTQYLIDALSATDIDNAGAYKGNEYRTYETAVLAVDEKYNGTAKWGVLQNGNISDLRAAFIVGRGFKVSARDKGVDAKKEIAWTNAFFEYNDLDKEMTQLWAIEAEIEGKILIKIDMDKTPVLDVYKDYGYEMVAARYVSWLDKKYTVIASEDDYKKYTKVEWTGVKPSELEEKQFVYKKFGGRVSDPNQAQSKVMKCLSQVDNLDHALRDWREVNRIFAGPILYMKCVDAKEVVLATEAMDDKNFKIKKMLAGTGELGIVTFDMGGVTSLEQEILTNAKMISGTTGVSVQHMGLVELLKNRSTGDDQREALSAATVKDRVTWEGAYEELISKAMTLFNDTVYAQKSDSKKLNPSLIKVTIPVITQQHWANIEKVFFPAAVANLISQELYLEQLPDVDVDEELKRQSQNEETEIERIRKENEDLKREEPPFMGDEE